MGATPAITAAEEALDAAAWKHGSEGREWAEAHAELERIVFKELGLPWRREEHFVSAYDRDSSQ